MSKTPLWMMVSLVLFAVLGPGLGGAQPGQPEELEHPVVVELFTSQGCSSCPPADELLRILSRERNVVPLAFHVDYWNRLGWRDPFSSDGWSQRQRRYARTLRSNVYTPQAVVNGRLHVVGSDEARLREEIRRLRGLVPSASLSLTVPATGEDRIEITVVASVQRDIGKRDLAVPVAVFQNGLVTPVKAGENVRRTLKNDFVVRHLVHEVTVPGAAGSETEATVAVDLDPSWDRRQLGVVAFVQHPVSMRIYGATLLYLRDADKPRGSAEGLKPKPSR